MTILHDTILALPATTPTATPHHALHPPCVCYLQLLIDTELQSSLAQGSYCHPFTRPAWGTNVRVGGISCYYGQRCSFPKRYVFSSLSGRSKSGLAEQPDSQAMAKGTAPNFWSSVPSLAIPVLPLATTMESPLSTTTALASKDYCQDTEV